MYLLIAVVLIMVDLLPAGLKMTPRPVNFIVDVFSMMICVHIALRLVGQRGIAIAPKYLGLIALYIFMFAVSVIMNGVGVEPLIVGMRFHLKYLPFFLLPIFTEFSGQEIKKQLRFILPLLFIQLPIVIVQRFVFFRGFHSDFITGTLGISSHLSMVLICSIAVIFAFHLRGELTLKQFLGIALWVFLPASLNQTKSTLVFFPLALALPAFFLPRIWASAKLKNLFTLGVIVVILATLFAAVFQQTEGYSIFDKYEEELEGDGYLFTGSHGGIGEKKIGRGDALLLAMKDLSKDIAELVFGLGAGNVITIGSRSFWGAYVTQKLRYHGEMMTLTHLLWELGLSGVVIYMTFLLFIFRDSVFLSKSPDVFGVLGLGFTAVVTIVAISLVYKNIYYFNGLYVLFWYFSGVIAARAHRLRELVYAYRNLSCNYMGLHKDRAGAV